MSFFSLNYGLVANNFIGKLAICRSLKQPIITGINYSLIYEKNPRMFNYDLFSSSKCRIFVSISRARCHDNQSLLWLVNEGKVQEMHIDILGSYGRKKLIKNGKIHYYKHTSWKYIENKNPHDHTELKDIIDSCLYNDVSNAVLNRTERKFF